MHEGNDMSIMITLKKPTPDRVLLGGLPLVLSTGTGAELRRPLGITIVGGLLVSQLLTLYTTPVVYLYLDHLQIWCTRRYRRRTQGLPEEVSQGQARRGVEVGD